MSFWNFYKQEIYQGNLRIAISLMAIIIGLIFVGVGMGGWYRTILAGISGIICIISLVAFVKASSESLNQKLDVFIKGEREANEQVFVLEKERLLRRKDRRKAAALYKDKVYFIYDHTVGCIKIGVSKEPEKRLVSLQTGTTNKLSIICVMDGGYIVEEQLHRRFAHHRMSGEWFRYSDDIKTYIAELGNQ